MIQYRSSACLVCPTLTSSGSVTLRIAPLVPHQPMTELRLRPVMAMQPMYGYACHRHAQPAPAANLIWIRWRAPATACSHVDATYATSKVAPTPTRISPLLSLLFLGRSNEPISELINHGAIRHGGGRRHCDAQLLARQ